MSSSVSKVRSFNRTFTQRIGALSSSYLGRGLPLGQARVLFELGDGGIQIRQLRANMGLDSGYVSRMLRSLEKKGFVATSRDTADARVRIIQLTKAGKSELVELVRLSDEGAEAWLKPLSPRQQKELVAAMAKVEHLLRASDIEIQAEDPASAKASWCFEEFFKELEGEFTEGYDPELTVSSTAADLAPPKGIFFLASLPSGPVGCGGLMQLPDKRGEVKRMWVAKEVRGLGLGRRLLECIESEARIRKLKVLRLETLRSLESARALYAKSGYVEVEPFGDERYADFWFEKRLD
ncbi:MAG: DNA-binding MarR family transcriptional regulator/GNAT superfamily N-acetyltransferase [Planctomycetota bacterium]|jgi:DNA-binding MarR family transcriptional regulator/GNAT superfamily N-acetyltransferase